ncbi:GDSL esterase/lipase At1g33811-like [Lolium rigidum]|uniref:GDSL esterase/lipase At1g33811-like n=1 Tax=Lolium rigidum TaxID=89674 RepID=UPI001F5CFF2B|nr:GDSL esterase/lipase At1g33811-like [Lolium rigidum]
MGNDHLHRWVLACAVAAAMHMAAPLVVVQAAQQHQMVPCMYIFGDSLVDNGNNNNILSLARANYRPYGVDFPDGAAPAGRFTNGRTMVDLLADHLGFRPPLIPAYALAEPADHARGLNFASGAAGIRHETGNNLGGHYALSEQVEHFRTVVQGLEPGKSQQLGRCIYYVGMGSNDYLNNYFMPDYYPTARNYDPSAYAALLLADYERQITDLYALGARKFVIAGVGQIGCIPYELARVNDNPPPAAGIGIAVPGISISVGGGGRGNAGKRNGGCNEEINSAIAIYNKGLLAMVKRLNGGSQTPGARLVFLNAVNSGKDLAANAAAYGFTVLDRGCCGVGRNNGQITCLPMQTPCDDRSKYIFWDAFHPTEAANRIIAAKVFNSSSTADAYPINVSRLAAI